MGKQFWHISYKQNRVFGLDLFRAVAILAVVFGHSKLIIKQVAPQLAALPLPNGVEIFFVLSGFLIGGIIFKQVQSDAFGNWRQLLQFWRFRWFRTLPNYYLVLLLNVLLAYVGFSHYNFDSFSWKFLFFLQNFTQPFFSFYPESWSLAVEEWFYILFPFVLFAAFLAFPSGRKKWVSLAVVVLFIGVPIALKWHLAAEVDFSNKEIWGQQMRRVVVYRLDSIMLGVLFAWVAQFSPHFFKSYRLVLLLLGVAINMLNRIYNAQLNSDFSEAMFLVINGFSMAMLLPFFAHWRVQRGIIARAVTYISVTSYALYLVHFSLVLSPMVHFFTFSDQLWSWVYYFFFWIASLFLAHLLYKYFEKPMTDLRQSASQKSANAK